MSVLQKLTEGVVSRNVRKEGEALLTKWEATGLLEGLNEGQQKQGMAVLLENQAKELLREASSMAAGDVEGFAAVAFPIVRRVFGGLIANDLVSVQPMSLPSGLIFFLDFTHTDGRNGAQAGFSVYGGTRADGTAAVARAVTGGISLDTISGPGGHYEMGNAMSSPTGSVIKAMDNAVIGALGAGGSKLISALTAAEKKILRWDPDLLAATTQYVLVIKGDETALVDLGTEADLKNLSAISASAGTYTNAGTQVRRLTFIDSDSKLNLVFQLATDFIGPTAGQTLKISYSVKDKLSTGNGLGAIVGADAWGLEEPSPQTGNSGVPLTKVGNGKNTIAEIDIKVDSIAVTAQTKKLKAKWSPELGQDLNAYHNLDAEVELTGILSEQIALEIDRELLGELVDGATAGTRYWSRAPGLFVSSDGTELGATSAAPDFTGTVSEWYETLIETINDVSAQIHRKTLRGGANFVVCGPEVANILEFTSGFRASVTADQDRGTIGAVKSGSLSKKFDVYVDPYFLRNVCLIGRKGSSFLESGFVYAPYVPLQVTPTIFGTEDFVPRKGVMTRYAKQMVRPDMYGLVVVRGLLGEAGA
jgi:hypothetical protein